MYVCVCVCVCVGETVRKWQADVEAAASRRVTLVASMAVVCVVVVVLCATVSVCYIRHRRMEDYLRTYASRHYNIRSETVTDSAFALSECLHAFDLNVC
jgi:heme/copper-type cytochrome/quinol oxidase subunit 2